MSRITRVYFELQKAAEAGHIHQQSALQAKSVVARALNRLAGVVEASAPAERRDNWCIGVGTHVLADFFHLLRVEFEKDQIRARIAPRSSQEQVVRRKQICTRGMAFFKARYIPTLQVGFSARMQQQYIHACFALVEDVSSILETWRDAEPDDGVKGDGW
jgi:hypothetical protein